MKWLLPIYSHAVSVPFVLYTKNRKCQRQNKYSKKHYCCERLSLTGSLSVTIYSSCYSFDVTFYNRHHNMDVTEPVCLFSNVLLVNTSGQNGKNANASHSREVWKPQNAAFRSVEMIHQQVNMSLFVFFAKNPCAPKAHCALWPYQHCITDRTPCQLKAALNRIVGRQHSARRGPFSKIHHHLTTARAEVLTPLRMREGGITNEYFWKEKGLSDQHDIMNDRNLSVEYYSSLLYCCTQSKSLFERVVESEVSKMHFL